MVTKADLDKLNSKEAKVKYGFAKELISVASEQPGELYGFFDDWERFMSGENRILAWTAMDIIGYLSAIDVENRIDEKTINSFIRMLHGGVLISCNHAIFALGRIARHKPQYKALIYKELFNIQEERFETEECRQIATGKVLEVIKSDFAALRNDAQAITFIQKASESGRNSIRKKAEQLLRELDKSK